MTSARSIVENDDWSRLVFTATVEAAFTYAHTNADNAEGERKSQQDEEYNDDDALISFGLDLARQRIQKSLDFFKHFDTIS